MSWLSSGLKKLGGAAKKIAPFAKYLPTPIGAALSVVDAKQKPGGILKNLGGDFLNRAKTAGPLLLGGAGAGALGGAAGGGGGGVLGSLGSGANSAFRALGGAEGLIDLGLGAGSIYQGYRADKEASKAQKRAEAMQNRALAFQEGQYAERAPYRKLGMDMMMNQDLEDVGGLYQSQNPFARRRA